MEAAGSVFINILCILFLSVQLLGIFLQRNAKQTTTKYFLNVIFSVILFLIVNVFCDALSNKSGHDSLLYILNLMTYLIVDLIVSMFSKYIYSFIEFNTSKKNKYKNIVLYLCALRALLIFVLALTGNLFTITNGVFEEITPGSIFPYFFEAIIMIVLIIIIVKNKKSFTKRQLIVILAYELFPLMPLVVEMFTNNYAMTSASLTLSLTMVYVLMQDTTIERSKVRENILQEITNTDLLTGINNRRSYYNCISSIKSDENVGVVFCDLNGLKYTNDHFGHAKGDELIKTFADMLVDMFKENAFRISGDEFVVLLPKYEMHNFENIVNEFNKQIEARSNIAALGVAFGMGCCIEKLIAEAEEKMYEDKKIKKAGR